MGSDLYNSRVTSQQHVLLIRHFHQGRSALWTSRELAQSRETVDRRTRLFRSRIGSGVVAKFVGACQMGEC